MNMEKIRSFIAIELPQEVKLALARLQDQLKSGGGAPVKWVDPEIMHMTLKFLGNIDTGIIGKVTAALEEACRGVHPFPLGLSGLGVFPNPRRVQVVWVGLRGEVEKLGQLQKRIDTSLDHLGFKAELRPFTPHLTLARVREQATPEEKQVLGQLVSGTTWEGSVNFNVAAVHLMRSQLTREGPIYTRISPVTLQ
jgi:RNA 2',3'-cyclic 3'-phosphodiesterase